MFGSLVGLAVSIMLVGPIANVAIAPRDPVSPNSKIRQEVSELWHQAGVAYARHDLHQAHDLFQSIVELCPEGNSTSLRWYEGVAEYGLASTAARLGDSTQTRLAIVAAMNHEFWNFEVLRADGVLRKVAGSKWLDSVVDHYAKIRDEEKRNWPVQSPILILPHCRRDDAAKDPSKTRRFLPFDSLSSRLLDSMKIRRPLIIALHGGNASYREFASHWRAVADSLQVAVLIPPGTVRHSSLDNSWDDNFTVTESAINSYFERYQEMCGYQPRVFVAGFSQGALAAIKYGMLHADRVAGIISVAGYIDRPLPEEVIESAASTSIHVLALTGEFETSGFRNSMLQARERCLAHHVPFDLTVVPGMVHEVPEDLASRLAKAWPFLSPMASSGSTPTAISHRTQG